jgi:hypothetical protein
VIEKSFQIAALAPIVQSNRRYYVKFARALEHLGNIILSPQLENRFDELGLRKHDPELDH